MKASDFNLSKDIKFDFAEGMVSFFNSRLVIFNANAIGLLRQNVINEIGFEKARDLFYRFGYQHGYSDFMQMKLGYEWDSQQDLMTSGPTIHTWQGEVNATPKEVRINPEKKEFYFTGIWKNSYEAQQHLMFNEEAKEPVCWSLMGYASGWSTGFWGSKIICIEPVCMGMGHDHCEWELKPLEEWDDRAKPYINAVKNFI